MFAARLRTFSPTVFAYLSLVKVGESKEETVRYLRPKGALIPGPEERKSGRCVVCEGGSARVPSPGSDKAPYHRGLKQVDPPLVKRPPILAIL